ncbi:hypothetical protein GBA52_009625 [Prunus armeniaca]|nr:hypothetical protein GBA52_009625 [Prunus armeniaca]
MHFSLSLAFYNFSRCLTCSFMIILIVFLGNGYAGRTFSWICGGELELESEPLLDKKSAGKSQKTELEHASFLSKLTFAWINPLLKLGSSKTLALEDIPSLVSEDEAALAYQKFAHAWDSLSRERSSSSTTNLVLQTIAKLKLSSLGRRRHSAGEIVNYIAVDAYRMGEFPWWLQTTWSNALQVFLAIGVLFWVVGLGALPVLIPLFICGLLNVPFAKALQKCQSQFMIAQDERLRATSEILNTALRSIGDPVRLIPEALSVMIQVKVSFDRLNVFLLDDELKDNEVRQLSSQNSDEILRIERGIFSWYPESAVPTLRDVNLEVQREQKVAVCGPVGAGKSSLLCAILGEMPKISGTVSLKQMENLIYLMQQFFYTDCIYACKLQVDVFGTLAYVSQTSWIQSGTVRDNILYGRPVDEIKYDKAIKACALDKDIDSFDHGDLTEIGQRGLNMSGGQKQRIQLARAVYSDADIYLLDDPFSAVDAHTAAILFQ